jgi:hypothetical protein
MAEAAAIMGEENIGSRIVTKYETPVGTVKERDLLSKFWLWEKISWRKSRDNNFVSAHHDRSNCQDEGRCSNNDSEKDKLATFDRVELFGGIIGSDLINGLPEVPESVHVFCTLCTSFAPVGSFMVKGG